MSDKEREILEKIEKALPEMTELEKGYMLGVAETTLRKGGEDGCKSTTTKNNCKK